MTIFRNSRLFIVSAAIIFIAGAAAVRAQSSDQNFPTPITSNELNGTIKARDVGDARLTRHFYAFDGGQGDIFINVVTKNFTGDIDVFTVEGLRPLAKMIIYGDSGTSETGRLVYLRKGERLLLRIEGRSPDDDPATYRIKFGGSFIALAPKKEEKAPTIEKTGGEDTSGIKVNSVGTIVAVTPKPKPPKALVEAATVPADPVAKAAEPIAKANSEKKPELKKPEVVVTEPTEVPTVFGKKKSTEEKTATTTTSKATTTSKTTRPARTSPPAKTTVPPTKTATAATPPEEKKPDPLASIRLVVQLKSGDVIERPMSEVLKFGVESGMLTVITRDGKISRYSILAVAKVTIE